MKAMILAAGCGRRMLPLTAHTHKGLLTVNGESLLERHIKHLAKAGIKEIVINVYYFAEQIIQTLGDGKRFGVTINYSEEKEALEVGGGIINALPLLGDDPFIVINGDVYTDFPLETLYQSLSEKLGHLVLVPNPTHVPAGDFAMDRSSRTLLPDGVKYTFAGIAVYRSQLFCSYPPGLRQLKPIIDQAILQRQLSAEIYHGQWIDVGTPERLQHLRENPKIKCI